jgi:hypothetical protein
MKEENRKHPFYDIVSTVNYWVFVRYDGNKWIEAKPLAVNNSC